MLIAFDIDGTLADLSHRLHWVKNLPANGKPDWEAFFARVRGDKPIPEMVELCNDLHTVSGTEVIFVSGRNEVCREDTEWWLKAYTIVEHHLDLDYPEHGFVGQLRQPLLYMRSEGDRRADFIIKAELANRIEADYNQLPDIVFDDRQQVVDMWRSLGVRCCQVAKGDF